MTTQRAVLAGGCFWGMQDLFRRQEGVLSTRVGYTGGEVANATYRNHGSHAEAIEVIFDPARISYRRLLEFFSRFTIPARGIVKATMSAPATDLRSSTPTTSRGGSRRKRSKTSMLLACGRVRSLRNWRRQALSGRLSPNIRTTLSVIRTATLAILSGQTGGCQPAPTGFPTRPRPSQQVWLPAQA
jgi:hypothetical protein